MTLKLTGHNVLTSSSCATFVSSPLTDNDNALYLTVNFLS